MDKVVNLVAERAGISQAQAKTAVDTVASYLKDRLPPGVASQVDTYLKSGDSEGRHSGMGDKLGDALGGITGKK